MLKLKVFQIDALQMPEMVLSGSHPAELFEEYLEQSPMTNCYSTAYGRVRRAARYAGLPLWGILRNKNLQNCAFLADQMVKHGLAEWVEFNEEEFNPRKAITRIRSSRLNNGERSKSHCEAISAALKQHFETISEEKKLEWNRAKSEGWKNRKENQKIAKRNRKKIEEGLLPRSADEVPSWFSFQPNKKEVSK